MLQIRWNSQNCEGIKNNYVQRINLKRDKYGELGGKGLKTCKLGLNFFSDLLVRKSFSPCIAVLITPLKSSLGLTWWFRVVAVSHYNKSTSFVKNNGSQQSNLII